VAPVSELDQLREELDELRDRVTVLEFDKGVANNAMARASSAARAADRQLSISRSECREAVRELTAGMSQVISLLSTSAACLPARLPENTQSASESPLT
jgi:hypothetical protein